MPGNLIGSTGLALNEIGGMYRHYALTQPWSRAPTCRLHRAVLADQRLRHALREKRYQKAAKFLGSI